MLTDEQLLRFSRQIMLPQIDVAGQEALQAAHVLIVGLGGLGSPAALYLASAGVGRLTLVDHDQVDHSNLQRQIIHTDAAVGNSKVQSAAERLAALAPQCHVHAVAERVAPDTLDSLLDGVLVVLDCSDNFATRFLLNRHCVERAIPLVSGAAIRLEGQLSVFDSRQPDSPCYQCLYPDSGQDDQRCATNGVLAPVVGVIGSLQALEAIKLITNMNGVMVGRLLVMDAQFLEFRTIRLQRDTACVVCGDAARTRKVD